MMACTLLLSLSQHLGAAYSFTHTPIPSLDVLQSQRPSHSQISNSSSLLVSPSPPQGSTLEIIIPEFTKTATPVNPQCPVLQEKDEKHYQSVLFFTGDFQDSSPNSSGPRNLFPSLGKKAEDFSVSR